MNKFQLFKICIKLYIFVIPNNKFNNSDLEVIERDIYVYLKCVKLSIIYILVNFHIKKSH